MRDDLLAVSRSSRYLPFGDTALLVEFGNTISAEINHKVTSLSNAIVEAEIRGVQELVPTYRSLLIRYDPSLIGYYQLVSRIKNIEENLVNLRSNMKKERITIPVVYGGEYGPDLSFVARYNNLSEEQVVKLHSAVEYKVYMLGFVAGFPYLGEVVDEIAAPRLETPRLKVPAGSVGIAGKQTGIYPCEAPGGWQIIGRTPLELFNPNKLPPALLTPGDLVKFRSISQSSGSF